MALYISSDCINCGKCIDVCPTNAIYENGMPWNFKDGTEIEGEVFESSVAEYIDVNTFNHPLEISRYFIVSEKCTECFGFNDKPQCKMVCPENCIIRDDEETESKGYLLTKLLNMFPTFDEVDTFRSYQQDHLGSDLQNLNPKENYSPLKQVRDQLSNGNLKSALVELSLIYGDDDHELIMLRSAYVRLLKQIRLGIIDTQSEETSLNRLNNNILNFIKSKIASNGYE
jgi:ferredoxin